MKSLSYLNKFLWRYRLRLFMGFFFIVLSNIFAIFPAQLIRESFNEVQRYIQPEKASEIEQAFVSRFTEGLNLTETLIFFASMVILMALMKGLFTFLTRQTIIIVSRLIEFDLKNEIFNHYQQLSPSFYRRNNTGDIMNRISEDVSKVRMYLGPGIMYSVNLLVLFTLVVSTMLSINVRLTLFALMPLPVLSTIIYFVSNKINKKSEKVQAQLSVLSNAAQESFSGIRILKSYVREANALSHYDDESTKYKNLALSLVKVEAIFFPVMMVLIGLSTILTIYIGGLEAIAGRIQIGNIAEFVIYVNMLTWPVTALGWVTSLTQRAAASQSRINEFLQSPLEFEAEEGQFDGKLQGEIEFNEVNFTYEDSGINALMNINFTIKEGESLGIIGKTGSGKSTMVDLLCRNLRAKEGEVLIDGKNILSWNIASLRSQMGVVPQEGFLFSETISENIAFGTESRVNLENEVKEAASESEILENIEGFPSQFETMVGERGITLSGGQKQRISIARALIRKPKILVFDDCLSAVDTVTEEKILSNFKKQIQGRTSVIVSHRVSSVKSSNEIIVLDKGEIVERGSHKDLISKKGHYYELYVQQKIQEEESLME